MQIWRFWKPGDWDLEPGDFQNMCQIIKKSIICLRVFLFYLFSAPCCTLWQLFWQRWLNFHRARVLDHEQPSWFVFEAKLPQKPLRTNVSLEWGWHLHCTQFSLTNRLITLIRLLRTQIVCYSFIFSSLCRIFLGNFEVFGSPWDLKAKPWDREMASQTVTLTVKPWELEGLQLYFWTSSNQNFVFTRVSVFCVILH